MASDETDPIQDRIAQHEALYRPSKQPSQAHGGNLPDTLLSVATVAFLLGAVFSLGAFTFLAGGLGFWWSTPQLGFFVAAWAFFHWAEFAVTAGWNLEKSSVDCEGHYSSRVSHLTPFASVPPR